MLEKKFTVAGAGLVGSLFSLYLARKGHHVDVFERRKDMRAVKLGAGKSINLSLSTRGWKALAGVGIEEDVKKMGIPMHKRIMHALDGSLTHQPYGKDGEAIYSVSRGGLNALLMDLAEREENINFHFNEKCIDVDLKEAQATFENTLTKELTEVKADHLVGADGVYSAVRNKMQRQDRFNFEKRYIEHGYKELVIPANADGTHQLEVNALHIWPRGNYMLIALPNLDGSFTCTLFFPYEGAFSFNSLKTDEDILHFFTKVFPDAVPLMPTLLEDYKENPTASLGIIRCFPWTVSDKVMLIGDASHATVPFYGQGMNSGFEDCTIFNQFMEQYGDDWSACFKAYELERKANGDAIQELSLHNFIVMRDKTADPKFLLQKKIEKHFSDKYPDKWLPLYSMVTFSNIPYAKAWSLGQKQEAMMQKVLQLPGIETKWDSVEVERLMLAMIE
jgi:kynurenine 3-monooxygenase|tara:strand:+ start:1597 stop:2940 length:1344 start_codon:yes stop_codon:yes gene_type:complete